MSFSTAQVTHAVFAGPSQIFKRIAAPSDGCNVHPTTHTVCSGDNSSQARNKTSQKLTKESFYAADGRESEKSVGATFKVLLWDARLMYLQFCEFVPAAFL